MRLLREAGYEEQAALIEREIVGRNVIPGHWMFQIIEAYNSTYYQPFAAVERDIVDEVAGGRDHLMEARLKTIRRTPHHPDHTATPPPEEGPAWRRDGGGLPELGSDRGPHGVPRARGRAPRLTAGIR